MGGLGEMLGGAGDGAMQGVGTLARIIDLFASARGGNLGRNLMQQAAFSQDPAGRAQISGSPFLAGFTGNYGSRQPTPQDMPNNGSGLASPSSPDRVSQFQANMPPLNLEAQLDMALKGATVPYTQARTRGLNAESDLYDLITGGGGGTGKFGDLELSGANVGPFQLRRPEVVNVPRGTKVLGGGNATPGSPLGPGKVVGGVTENTTGKIAQLQAGVARAKQAMPSIARLLEQDKAGQTPLDRLLPSGQGGIRGWANRALLPAAEKVPGLKEFTPAGTFGNPIHGESIASRAGGNDREATELRTLLGEAANVAKALGDAGILSNQDIERVIDYLIPSTYGTAEDNKNKAMLLLERLGRVVSTYEEMRNAGSDEGSMLAQLNAAVMAGVPAGKGEQSTPTTTGSTTTASTLLGPPSGQSGMPADESESYFQNFGTPTLRRR